MKRDICSYTVDFDLKTVIKINNKHILFSFCSDWENRSFQVPLIKETNSAEAIFRIINGQLEALKKLDEDIDLVFFEGMPYRPDSPDELIFYIEAVEGGFNNENAISLEALSTDYKKKLWKQAIHNAGFYHG